MSNNFAEAIMALTKIRSLIRDNFFNKKLGRMIAELVRDYIKFMTADKQGTGYVITKERFTNDINVLAGFLSDLNYLGLLRTSPLFLRANKILLLLKLNVVTLDRGKLPGVQPEKGKDPRVHHSEKIVTAQRPAKTINSRLNTSKKKIFEFIKSSPNTRTKDIINEFNALSDRTVKRNLTELMQIGLLKKRVENKAVYYSAID